MTETVELRGAGQSKVVVHEFGAHVTSWINASGREMIYTSPAAIYDGKKAIRGGIPICFPQFAKSGPLKQHGFARNMLWSVDASFTPEDKQLSTRLVLRDTEETRASAWPHFFEVRLTVALEADGNSLTITMDVSNTNLGGVPFTFTTALHSYFACHSEQVSLPYFDGTTYQDKVDSADPDALKTQVGEIVFGHEVDRVYLAAADKLAIPQAGLTLIKENMPEAIVWNPHAKKAAELADLPDDGWKHFICIEPARVMDPAIVEPGKAWSGSLRLISSA